MIDLNDLRRESAALRPELLRALEGVVDSGWYILGERVRRFEERFAAYLGAAQVLGVANGTDALEIALGCVGVGPGDAVLTVANAGGYASAAIRARGAVPRFVDVDPEHGLLDASVLAPALEARPRALVVTHLYGRMAPVEAAVAAARAAGVAVIEDCAQAHGARRNGALAGTIGDAGCFSFYPTKNLGALGDGGALATNDAALAARMRRARQYGWEEKYRVVEPFGRNTRLDELQAAVLEVKLGRLDAANARRRAIAAAYAARIRNPHIAVPARGGEDDVVHLFVVRSGARDRLREHLAKSGVGSEVHYPIPDHQQSAFAGARAPALPVTERLAREVLTIPLHASLRDEEVDRVVDACNGFRP